MFRQTWPEYANRQLPGTIFVQSTTASLSQKRSEYEDRYIEALVTVSKYKRLYASQLEIDVYTTNPKAQEEMNRIGWAAALGNWSPAVILYPFPGPAKATYSAFSWSDTLNRLVTEKSEIDAFTFQQMD